MPMKPDKRCNKCGWTKTICTCKKKPAPDTRGSINDRYGEDWITQRTAQLKQHPFCAMCGADGKVVDHVDGIENNKYKLQTLCERCHNEKTAMDRKRRRLSWN
jgi:5-methylcytosine-specific restriction endonuclease McrA